MRSSRNRRATNASEITSAIVGAIVHRLLDWFAEPRLVRLRREVRAWRALADDLRDAIGIDADEDRNVAVTDCCRALIEYLEDVEDGD